MAKSSKQTGYSGVYWDEKIPTILGILKTPIVDKGLNKGDGFQVQFEQDHFSINVRCKSAKGLFFIRVTELTFMDGALISTIKSNRLKLIAKGLMQPIAGFDP